MGSFTFHCIWQIDHISDTLNNNIFGYPFIASDERHRCVAGHGVYKFRLHLNPNGFNEATKEYVSVFVKMTQSPRERVKVMYRVAIMDRCQNRQNCHEGRRDFTNSQACWGFPTFILRSALKNFLQNETLFLYWEIKVILDDFLQPILLFDCPNHALQNANWAMSNTHQWRQHFDVRLRQPCAATNSATTNGQVAPVLPPQKLHNTLHWRIHRFSSRCSNEIEGFPVIEERFHCVEMPQYRFCVRLYPKGKDESCKNHVSLFLHLDDDFHTASDVHVFFKCCIENKKGERFNMYAFQHTFKPNINSSIGYAHYISHIILFDAKMRFLPNEVLTLFIETQVILDTTISQLDLENYFRLFGSTNYGSIARVSITDDLSDKLATVNISNSTLVNTVLNANHSSSFIGGDNQMGYHGLE